MKIKKIAICILVAICLMVATPYNIYALNPSQITAVDYSQYITDIQIDGDNDIVTLTLPLDKATAFDRTGAEIPFTGEDYIVESYKDTGYTYTQFRFDDYNNGIYFERNYQILPKNYDDQFRLYPLGNNYIIADDLPSGTVISYTLKAFAQTTSDFYENGEEQYAYLYGTLFCTPYAIARSKLGAVLEYNAGSQEELFQDTSEDSANLETFTLSTTFNKTFDTEYLNPYLFFRINDMYNLYDYDQKNSYVSITVSNVQLSFSISSALREQQQSGKTNELLQYILDGTEEQNNSANDFNNSVNDINNKADNALNDLNSLNKPDVNNIANSVNPFDIVSENQMGDYTNIFSSMLSTDIVRNMLLLCITFSLVSLVLFGKKG